ncbi:protein eiger isoform X2 [Belonocnema kinseyi]|uniref:protein eiger isoform X2 n=1 Tax=Belonocnema kinseyi TaxID=2817044 RepID=UPI00143CD26C|nr:protein eiger isoform X2 [Belonocnema kinseyi]
MTSVLSDGQKNVGRMKQKPQNQKGQKDAGREETRSFLSFSRENLSLSNSDLEQGFNKKRLRVRKHTLLSILALALALICFGIEVWKVKYVVENAKELEIWKVKWVVENAREIEILKRDVDSLKHTILEKDLLDELNAFEEKLYAEEENDEEDLDMEYFDYYDDESPNYSDDYQVSGSPTGSSGLLDLPETASTSEKDLEEILMTLRKVEAKRGQDLEKCIRETLNDSEKEKPLEKQKDAATTPAMLPNFSDTRNISDAKRKRSVLERNSEDSLFLNGDDEINHFLKNHNHNTTKKGIPKTKPTLKEDQEIAAESTPTKTTPEVTHSTTSEYREIADVDSDIRITKKKVSGHRKSRKMLLWNRVRQDNMKVKRLKENLEEAIASRSLGRGLTRRHLKVPRQVFAVHYGGDSSLFSDDDEHTGNGRAKHSEGIFKAWKASDWVADLGMNKHFFLSENGRLSIQEPGLYLAYAQIHYLDEHDENGFHMLVNGRPILQCMVYSPGTGHKSRTCFSAQVTVLEAGDLVILKDVAAARYTLFQKDKSFFGLVKLGDWRQTPKHQQHSSISPEKSLNS